MTATPRTRIRHAAVLGALALLPLSGCSGSSSTVPHTSPGPHVSPGPHADASRDPAEPSLTSADSPRPHRTSAAELCTVLVRHWAGVMLVNGRGAGLDWEQKGLSTAQRDILDEVVAAARAERSRRGTAAARDLIDRRTRRLCAAHVKGSSPSAERHGTDDRHSP
ncbi:hypothetical protein ACFYYR_21895 [Streptomyces sp. NPDC001922]|uniref:hypothetical protein n=1 Tax=Streptomyces sp. NPDC001922 TaxID=3364624 RepID=UPI0036A334DC